jgi:transcription-repair coupling factor (superfamily II helicase)
VLGDRLIKPHRKTRRAENYLTEAQTLSPGDLVVHVDHGVGRYKGLETIEAMGAPHECLALEYAGGDRLFLPVENIELLSATATRRGCSTVSAAAPGRPRRPSSRNASARSPTSSSASPPSGSCAPRKAPILEPPGDMWEAFNARFPYEETDDQLAPSPMCWRTWNAAARWTGWSGRCGLRQDRGGDARGLRRGGMRALQVAVIAPTTLLARQHAKTFRDRFRGFPVKVRQLSRFVPAKEAADTKRGMADGSVDIVIGTHALLAKGIRFKDLGLLVIDEEQRFGVGHKERLKELRSDVHVLTLSATPIPRTLQMSLSGVRDLDDRHAARRPAGDPHLCQRVRRGDDPRGAAARALPGRAELLRRAPDRGPCRDRGFPARTGARGDASWPPMARWRPASSTTG